MDIILLGMQGAGKGTLSQAIIEKYNLPLFETGAQLRKLAQEDSDLGRKVASIIEAGHLVPQEVIMDIIENFLKTADRKTPIIFDGIPRNPAQAHLFDNLMKKHGRDYICTMITLSEETALQRLTTRRLCKKCKTVYPAAYEKNVCKCGGELITRTDDTPDAIKTRIKTFKSETLPILEHYKQEGRRVIEINGEPTIEEVVNEALTKVDPFLK